MTQKGKSKSPIILTPGMTMIPGQSYTLPDPLPPKKEEEKEYVSPRQKRKMRRWQQKKKKGRVKRAVATKQRY